MDNLINSADVSDMLLLIDDGFLFERFAQEFLSARMGYSFMSSGGIKDRGIDGFEYCSEIDNKSKTIFQISIDKKPDSKIRDTVDKLKSNDIEYKKLFYVTNIEVKNKDVLIDNYFDNDNIILTIYDGTWIANNSNNSPSTLSIIKNFSNQHLRKYQKPGEGFVVNDYVSNPKLYVYLMQQIERDDDIENLNNKLIESLILYSLRETDPDNNSLLSSFEIFEAVKNLLNFEIERLQSKINKRLNSLTKKQNRKVNHHANVDKYCLPYETRLQIMSDNSRDKIRFEAFINEAEIIIKKNLKGEKVRVQDVTKLLSKTLEKIYYRQGFEFSEFLLNGGCKDIFESNLHETVAEIIYDAGIVDINTNKVKSALILSIRDLIYSGSKEAKEYLRSLSRTYQMLFLLKCEPKIVEFFLSMAGSMRIFVCTSILVPALSEIYLDSQNQRYWSLLKSAKLRGVKLIINEAILYELDFHIRRSKHIFETNYQHNIDFYSNDIPELVDQILVRAYLYAYKGGRKETYDEFISNFITVDGLQTKQELIDFLSVEFGIEFVSDRELDVEIQEDDFNQLVDKLKDFKKSEDKAKTDAKLILTIYALRDKHGESKSSLDGYKTWWLSSDTMTHRSVSSLFRDRYPVSCYMRPDFLYNYISFTPTKEKVSDLYKNTFSNLLGVQISNHVSPQISGYICDFIKQHENKVDGKRTAQIRNLIDDLKVNPNIRYKDQLKSFFNKSSDSDE